MFKLQHKITPFLGYDHQASDAAARFIRLCGNPLAEAMPYELIRRVARQRVKENASKALGRGTK